MFFKIGVTKIFVIFTRTYLCWSLFLIKLTQKTSKKLKHRWFLVNIAKFLRTLFLRDHSSGCFCCFKKICRFSGKHWWRRLNTFILFINITEFNKMLMCYYNGWHLHIHITWVIFQEFIHRDLKRVAFLARI